MQNALLQVQAIATTSTASTEIQIPNRKERGPTDILKVYPIRLIQFLLKTYD